MKLFLCYPKQKKCLSEGLKKGVKKGDEDICHRKCVSKEGRLNLRTMHLQENYEQKQTFADVLQINCS